MIVYSKKIYHYILADTVFNDGLNICGNTAYVNIWYNQSSAGVVNNKKPLSADLTCALLVLSLPNNIVTVSYDMPYLR